LAVGIVSLRVEAGLPDLLRFDAGGRCEEPRDRAPAREGGGPLPFILAGNGDNASGVNDSEGSLST
jgi:hypothetical protein